MQGAENHHHAIHQMNTSGENILRFFGELTNLKGFLKHRYHSLFSKKLKRQSLIPVMACMLCC